MDKNRKEELLTRWTDGVLTEGERKELEPLLAEYPELEAGRKEYLAMRGELRAVVPASVDPPYPDFFNTHLERLIRESRNREVKSASGVWRMLSWWLAPAALAAVVLAFLLGMRFGGPHEGPVLVSTGVAAPAVYSPLASVHARALQDETFGGTVIVLEGLDEIPNSVDLFQASAPGRAPERYYISTKTLY